MSLVRIGKSFRCRLLSLPYLHLSSRSAVSHHKQEHAMENDFGLAKWLFLTAYILSLFLDENGANAVMSQYLFSEIWYA